MSMRAASKNRCAIATFSNVEPFLKMTLTICLLLQPEVIIDCWSSWLRTPMSPEMIQLIRESSIIDKNQSMTDLQNLLHHFERFPILPQLYINKLNIVL